MIYSLEHPLMQISYLPYTIDQLQQGDDAATAGAGSSANKEADAAAGQAELLTTMSVCIYMIQAHLI